MKTYNLFKKSIVHKIVINDIEITDTKLFQRFNNFNIQFIYEILFLSYTEPLGFDFAYSKIKEILDLEYKESVHNTIHLFIESYNMNKTIEEYEKSLVLKQKNTFSLYKNYFCNECGNNNIFKIEIYTDEKIEINRCLSCYSTWYTTN